MPLLYRTNGTTGVNIATASWWNDFMNLLTGSMFDQLITAHGNVTVTNGVAAPIAPVLTAGTGGNLSSGTYLYAVAYGNSQGVTALSPTASVVSAASGATTLTIPVSPVLHDSANTAVVSVTSRVLYRSKVGGTQLYLLATVADNTTTTYSDTLADTALTTLPPTYATIGGTVSADRISTPSAVLTSSGTLGATLATDATGSLITYNSAGVVTGKVGPNGDSGDMHGHTLALLADYNPTAPTGTYSATGGSLGVGTYMYAVAYANAAGQSMPGPTLTVTSTASTGSTVLTVPVSATTTGLNAAPITHRILYRTVVNSTALMYLSTIADNTTTAYTDTVADSTLVTATIPTYSTLTALSVADSTGNKFSVSSDGVVHATGLNVVSSVTIGQQTGGGSTMWITNPPLTATNGDQWVAPNASGWYYYDNIIAPWIVNDSSLNRGAALTSTSNSAVVDTAYNAPVNNSAYMLTLSQQYLPQSASVCVAVQLPYLGHCSLVIPGNVSTSGPNLLGAILDKNLTCVWSGSLGRNSSLSFDNVVISAPGLYYLIIDNPSTYSYDLYVSPAMGALYNCTAAFTAAYNYIVGSFALGTSMGIHGFALYAITAPLLPGFIENQQAPLWIPQFAQNAAYSATQVSLDATSQTYAGGTPVWLFSPFTINNAFTGDIAINAEFAYSGSYTAFNPSGAGIWNSSGVTIQLAGGPSANPVKFGPAGPSFSVASLPAGTYYFGVQFTPPSNYGQFSGTFATNSGTTMHTGTVAASTPYALTLGGAQSWTDVYGASLNYPFLVQMLDERYWIQTNNYILG